MTHKILLVITGSIAAYKSLDLIRQLKRESMEVTGILTTGGMEFITPLAVSSLTGTRTYCELFSLKDEAEMGHIRLTREHDLAIVAPASADFIAKMASGQADDIASATLLASSIPVLVAPAMNHRMWEHKATQRNLAQIQADGVHLIPPVEGEMACGEEGMGRMAEPDTIIRHIKQTLTGRTEIAPSAATLQHRPLVGRRALVTSGPTQEAIDPVRFISNHSSGKQGHAVAQALAEAGAEVTLISGPVNIPAPQGVRVVRVATAEEMYKEALRCLPMDIAVCAAAVADWTISNPAGQKIKKQKGSAAPHLLFSPTQDILAAIAQHPRQRPPLVIGFAAETSNAVKNAKEKRAQKKCDWILVNDVSRGDIFGADTTQLTFVSADTEKSWGKIAKSEAASALVGQIVHYFSGTSRMRQPATPTPVNLATLPSNSARARHLADLGMAKTEIARRLGINYAHVASALKPTSRKKEINRIEVGLAQLPGQKEKIRFLSKQGFTPGKIAKKLGLPLTEVKAQVKTKRKRKKSATKRPSRPPQATPKASPQSSGDISNLPTQASRIRYMAGLGVEPTDIANTLGVPHQTVLRLLNMKTPQKREA